MQNFLKSLNKPENMEKMWHFDGICIKFGQVQQIIQTFEFFFLKYYVMNFHFKKILLYLAEYHVKNATFWFITYVLWGLNFFQK